MRVVSLHSCTVKMLRCTGGFLPLSPDTWMRKQLLSAAMPVMLSFAARNMCIMCLDSVEPRPSVTAMDVVL